MKQLATDTYHGYMACRATSSQHAKIHWTVNHVLLHYEQKNYQEELTEEESFGFVADDTEDFAGFLSLGVLNLGIIRQLFFNSYRMFVTGHQLTTYMTVNKITNKHYKWFKPFNSQKWLTCTFSH